MANDQTWALLRTSFGSHPPSFKNHNGCHPYPQIQERPGGCAVDDRSISMRRLFSKVPYLIATVLLAYAVVSLVPPSVWSENRMTVALILGAVAVAFILYFKWGRNRLSFLNTWPTPVISSQIHRYLLLRDYTPRTARTRNQVLASLLIPFLTFLLLLTVTGAASLTLHVSDRFREVVYSAGLPLLLGCLFLNPVLHGLVFRLRARYDVRNALLSMVIYLPILVFALTALIHLTMFFRDDETPFLSILWFEVSLASYFGAIVCILVVVTHRIGIGPEPAPAMISHRYYRRTEIGVSLASLIGVAIILLIASQDLIW
ncbi:MAG: hypothetical protein OXD46_15510 [Chloroflexi bacterium]|nr:hypothetical protein [Chloroflexota bacterium]